MARILPIWHIGWNFSFHTRTSHVNTYISQLAIEKSLHSWIPSKLLDSNHNATDFLLSQWALESLIALLINKREDPNLYVIANPM